MTRRRQISREICRNSAEMVCWAGIRTIVTLECTEARKLGLTPSRYTTQKARLA